MDQRRLELKSLKSAYRKAKKKYVTLWKALGIVSLVFALLCTPVCMAVRLLDNVVAANLGGTFWKLKNPDSSAVYFQKDYATKEELETHTQELFRELAAESAVLLKNENGALPLQAGSKVSCFWDNLQSPLLFGELDLYTALQTAGFTLNETLLQFYQDKAVSGETGIFQYPQQVWDTVTDTAVLVTSGENGDTLEALCQRKAAGSLQKVIVLLADTVSVNLPDGVDSVLCIGDTAQGGAVAELLAGTVTPSGRLADTLCNFAGRTGATNSYGENLGTYILCQEGIYTGYRYYETRYEDFVMGTGNAGSFAYNEEIRYPFGYGLSYTAFAYSGFAVVYNEKSDKYEVTLTVTNSGTVPGKETVQVYAQTPYTEYDKQNLVEKPAVTLVGFGKTAVLAPGAQETLTVTVDRRDLAAYDGYGAKTYILEAGAYYLAVAADAHRAVNDILAAKGYTPESTQNRMDGAGDTACVYKWEQAELEKTYSATQNGVAITNRLYTADPNLYEGTVENASWLSRQDWEGTFPKASVSFQLTDTLRADLQKKYNPGDYPTVAMPTLGAENGLRLYDMVGLSFDDPQWETLLDQLSFAEMAELIGDGYGYQLPVASVEAPGLKKEAAESFGLQKTIASCFHKELVQEVGKALGNQCLEAEIDCLQLSAILTEDSFLSGKLTAAQVSGLQEKGIVTVVGGVGAEQAMWLNEQTARQRYLPAVQYAAELGAGLAASHICWGATDTGVVTAVFREEWGSNARTEAYGERETDYAYGVLSGVTAYNTPVPYGVGDLSAYENDPVIVAAMRQACHRNLYAVANSAGMNGVGENTVVRVVTIGYVTLCRAVTAVLVLLWILFAVLWCRGRTQWKKTQEYLNYRTLKRTLREEKNTK